MEHGLSYLLLNPPIDIYGHGKNTQKSGNYTGHSAFASAPNTYNCVDKEVHGRKRRILNQAFTAGAISSYEPIILHHVRRLCETVLGSTRTEWPLVSSDRWSRPKNMVPLGMCSWINSSEKVLIQCLLVNFVILDILSDLTYGKSFDLTIKPNLHWIFDIIWKSNRRSDLKMTFPWLFDVRFSHWYSPTRWASRDFENESDHISEFFAECSDERATSIEKAAERIDIVSALLTAHDPKTGGRFSDLEIWDEVKMMMAIGKSSCILCRAIQVIYCHAQVVELFRQRSPPPCTTSLVIKLATRDLAKRFAPPFKTSNLSAKDHSSHRAATLEHASTKRCESRLRIPILFGAK